MFKNMTISGKTNLITEILAAVVWLIAVASAGPDRLIVGVFSFPLLILVPICGWLLIPISKKILKKGRNKNWLEEDALVCRDVYSKFDYCCVGCHCCIGWRRGADKYD